MKVESRLKKFISATEYTKPADIKKLEVIFSAIDKYASSKNKDVDELRVLEVGCGRGGVTFPLASLGCQVTAFDIDEDSVEYIQRRIEKTSIKNLVITVDDAYTFDDGQTYDVVIASEVFPCVLEPSRLAASIARRMVAGSYLIVTIPNGYGPWQLKNRISPTRCLRRWNWLRHLLGKSREAKGSGKFICQTYTRGRLMSILSPFSLRPLDFGKSDSFLATLGPLYERSNVLGTIDIKLADSLPYWLASGWYFALEMEKAIDQQLSIESRAGG